MPNIFKRFSLSKEAQPYQFPDTEELLAEDDEVFEPLMEEELPEDGETELGLEEDSDAPEPEPAAEPEPEKEKEEEKQSPIDFAQIQADKIIEDARRQAEDILAKARLDAELECADIRAAAQEEGRAAGYRDGMAQAAKEGAKLQEEQAAVLAAEVERFLEKAGAELDRALDQSAADLRDLAMAVAEKVVCVSLKSSGDVISRMIQTAIDKRKRREWVHIYIAECDAKKLAPAPSSLTASLSALSDRVRIIPMADDESGTCIIEMPDEIIDASAATQLNNIRSLLMDASSGAGAGNFNLF